jgi:hypothetical protein
MCRSRHLKNAALCLGVLGFANPPISQPIALNTFMATMAFGVRETQRQALVVAEDVFIQVLPPRRTKAFWSFFSKKDCFLPLPKSFRSRPHTPPSLRSTAS